MIANSDHDSIFGTTICGVPSPLVPHQHPYPTRYHGPWFGTISQSSTYKLRPYANPVDAGPGMSGCPCSDGVGFFAAVGDESSISSRIAIGALIGSALGFGFATIQEKTGMRRWKTAALYGGVAVAFDMLLNREVYFGK